MVKLHYMNFTEKKIYVNNLKFPIFYQFCCQYPSINYFDKDDFVVDADDGEDENDEDFKPDVELKKSSPRKKSTPKGQLISKGIYEIIDFPKYR